MIKGAFNWLNSNYPQNYIIRKPLVGTSLSFVMTSGFLLLYRPLSPNDQKILGYEGAMTFYCFIASLTFLGMIVAFKKLPYFSNPKNWSLVKELLIIFSSIFMMSVVIFWAGFVIETTGTPRFRDSFQATFLIGIIPYLVFSMRNLSYFFPENKEFSHNKTATAKLEPGEEKINIVSRLKSENLSFYPDQFLFAESESNYVTFYLMKDTKLKKITIRNAIADIESQFTTFPYFFRAHRAFIVNLKMVSKKSGNTLGYRLRLSGVENEIPVSRQNTHQLNRLLKELFPDS